jgi:hypothetical protein
MSKLVFNILPNGVLLRNFLFKKLKQIRTNHAGSLKIILK